MKFGFFSKNWLVHKIVNRHLELAAKKFARGKLLDIGCGEKPYKEMFAPYVKEHAGLDHHGTLHDKSEIDIFGPAYDIPVEDTKGGTFPAFEKVIYHMKWIKEAINTNRFRREF